MSWSKDKYLDIINKNNSGLLNEICNVFSTIISLIKSNDYSIESVDRLPEVNNSSINKLTIELISPIYNDYQTGLEKNEMIDFNDMINMATKAILNNKFLHNYKYVIVDECQCLDLSY